MTKEKLIKIMQKEVNDLNKKLGNYDHNYEKLYFKSILAHELLYILECDENILNINLDEKSNIYETILKSYLKFEPNDELDETITIAVRNYFIKNLGKQYDN